MIGIVAAYGRALHSLAHPKVFWHLLWPALVTLLAWAAALYFAWHRAARGVLDLLGQIPLVGGLLAGEGVHAAALGVINVALLLLSVPLAYVLATIIVANCALPLMTTQVRAQEYGDVAVRGDDSLRAGLHNSLAALWQYLLRLFVCAPLLLVPGLGAVVLVLLAAAFDRRCLSYDVLATCARPEEIGMLRERLRWPLLLLGLLGSGLGLIPGVNLFAASLTGLAFTHYLLQALRTHRTER